MTPEVLEHRAGVTETAAGRESFEGAPGRMVTARVVDLDDPPSGRSESKTEVDILRAKRG
jgi:hypothetical protein